MKKKTVKINYCFATELNYSGTIELPESFYNETLSLSDDELVNKLKETYPKIFKTPEIDDDIQVIGFTEIK